MSKFYKEQENKSGQWKEVWQSGNKFVMQNKITGEKRNAERDIEGIKRGDYLQPVGKDRDAFLKKYGKLPDVPKEETDKFLLKHKNLTRIIR